MLVWSFKGTEVAVVWSFAGIVKDKNTSEVVIASFVGKVVALV